MNVFYEEDGGLKAAWVLADNGTSLQVEAPHGKRSKIKASSVLLRFERPLAGELMERAQAAAQDLDVDFLWQCCGAGEFGFAELAREYYGHIPDAEDAAFDKTMKIGAVVLALVIAGVALSYIFS